jgi:hypothetical protein
MRVPGTAGKVRSFELFIFAVVAMTRERHTSRGHLFRTASLMLQTRGKSVGFTFVTSAQSNRITELGPLKGCDESFSGPRRHCEVYAIHGSWVRSLPHSGAEILYVHYRLMNHCIR